MSTGSGKRSSLKSGSGGSRKSVSFDDKVSQIGGKRPLRERIKDRFSPGKSHEEGDGKELERVVSIHEEGYTGKKLHYTGNEKGKKEKKGKKANSGSLVEQMSRNVSIESLVNSEGEEAESGKESG
jgi:hypothetical protein